MPPRYQEAPHPYGESVTRLIDEFARLPGIGRKSAERMAYYILETPVDQAQNLARAVMSVKQNVHRCRSCHGLTESDICQICADTRRDDSQICIVEQPKDVTTLEASGVYHGKYHVLHGRIAPLEGINPEDLTINSLIQRIRQGTVREVVMATNPTVEGDGTSLYISNLLQEYDVKISRLARGIATGSVLEFANKEMLADALRGRQSM
jgi:recombination protein RecR